MRKPIKVLFLGHDASRSGAPLLLLELIKWLMANSDIKPSVLLKRGGPIESDFRALCPTRCLAEEYARVNLGFHRRIFRKLRLANIRQPDLMNLYPAEEYPVVYANTIDTCDLAMQLVGPGRSLVHHIHELAYAADVLGVTGILKKAVANTDLYIAVSQPVRDFLETEIGVPASKLRLIHEFPIATGRTGPKEEAGQIIRRQLGIPDDAPVIGMCGSPEWRKGSDLFVQLALHVKRQLASNDCHFVWLGGNANSHREPNYDAAKMGLREVCHFVEAVPNPEKYFAVFDIFALTSREDPFSVAMLEAALSRLPIVCFAKAGGGAEMVGNDAGIVVPYLDIPAMAKACVELLVDADRRRQLGEQARAKVEASFLLATQGPKVLAVIESAASRGTRAG